MFFETPAARATSRMETAADATPALLSSNLALYQRKLEGILIFLIHSSPGIDYGTNSVRTVIGHCPSYPVKPSHFPTL